MSCVDVMQTVCLGSGRHESRPEGDQPVVRQTGSDFCYY